MSFGTTADGHEVPPAYADLAEEYETDEDDHVGRDRVRRPPQVGLRKSHTDSVRAIAWMHDPESISNAGRRALARTDPAGSERQGPNPTGPGSADSPAGGSHAAGGPDRRGRQGAPSSYPSGDEPPYPGSTGSADPYGQPGGGYGAQQPPYGQPTPPPYGQQPPPAGLWRSQCELPAELRRPAAAATASRDIPTRTSRATPRSSTASRATRSSSTARRARPRSAESDEKTWGIISHISIPFFWFIGPLIGYLMYKDRSPFLKQVTTEALNFSILYSIVQVAGYVLVWITFGLINLAGFIVALIFCIMATMAASRHEFYKYPINARFIK